ncbi:hypothetical protein [Microcoleus sp. Pol12B5]|uniref:hypothetical protein n=1 Tax=Microcoleus sp. Pol12B5 TaxID=3055396 RepID=UPI002FD62FBE
MRSTNLRIQRPGDRILGWKGRSHLISFSQRAGDRFLVWKGQRDHEQIELYKQKEQEQKERNREQIEIGRKKEDKEKKRSRQLENIIFLSQPRSAADKSFQPAIT